MISKSYLFENNIQKIKNKIVLFYGENDGLKQDFKKQIKLSNNESELLNLTQEDVLKNNDNFFSEISNNSLFNKSKIFFISQCNDKILNTIEEINLKIDKIQIFLFSDILEKKSSLRGFFEKSKDTLIIPCYTDNEITLKKIILNKLEGFSGLNTQNINLIISNCNYQRDKLNNELQKIICYFTNKKLEFLKLEKLLDIKNNDNLNYLKDEILNGNKVEANNLLGITSIETEQNLLLLSLINLRLAKLKEIYELTRTKKLDEAFNFIKPPIFWKDKPAFLSQTKKWNENKIQKCLKQTYNIEIEIKSNSIVNKNILIKKLLVDICELANA